MNNIESGVASPLSREGNGSSPDRAIGAESSRWGICMEAAMAAVLLIVVVGRDGRGSDNSGTDKCCSTIKREKDERCNTRAIRS